MLRPHLRSEAAQTEIAALDPVMSSWRSLQQVPQQQRGPVRIVSPLELKLPNSEKPALVFNKSGVLCV